MLTISLYSQSLYSSFASSPRTDTTAATLHTVIPANEINDNVCKGVLSATLLRYPAPVLINFSHTFDLSQELRFGSGGLHLAKASGVARYIVNLPTGSENDVILRVDGYDAWFQLRPSVLLERYQDITRRANEKLALQFGTYATTTYGIAQRVLFPRKGIGQLFTLGVQAATPFHHYRIIYTVSILMFCKIRHGTEDRGRYFRDRYLNSGAAAGAPAEILAVL